jgi:hypothetical protein
MAQLPCVTSVLLRLVQGKPDPHSCPSRWTTNFLLGRFKSWPTVLVTPWACLLRDRARRAEKRRVVRAPTPQGKRGAKSDGRAGEEDQRSVPRVQRISHRKHRRWRYAGHDEHSGDAIRVGQVAGPVSRAEEVLGDARGEGELQADSTVHVRAHGKGRLNDQATDLVET